MPETTEITPKLQVIRFAGKHHVAMTALNLQHQAHRQPTEL